MKKYLMIQSCFFTIRHKNDKVEINKKEIMKGLDQIGQIAVPLTDIEKAIKYYREVLEFIVGPLLLLSVFLSSVNAQTLKTGFANIEGRKVYYEVKGEGPVVVLIHGFSLDTRMWDDQFDVLAKNYHVVRYDVSGYGRSSIPDRKISAVGELNELLRILDIQKATIVGMSMGGAIAINFTLEYTNAKTDFINTITNHAKTVGYNYQ